MRGIVNRAGMVVLVVGLTLVGATAPATARGNAVRMGTVRRTAAAVSTKRINIVDFSFSPTHVTIAKGTRVRWVNTGSVGHTSTSNNGKWDSGTIAAGSSFSRVFKKAGTFRFHCSIHPTMKGKVTVT